MSASQLPAAASSPVGSGAAAVAMAVGMGNDPLNIPPPSAEELAEMSGAGDRTQIVDGDSFRANANKTAVGVSPFDQNERTSNAVPSPEMQENISTGSFATETQAVPNLDATMPPKRKNGASSGQISGTMTEAVRTNGYANGSGSSDSDDMQPLDQTGFRPASEHGESNGDTGTNQNFVDTLEKPKGKSGNKPKIVIGDSPEYAGQTRIGPSPTAEPEEEPSDQTGERPSVPATRLFQEQATGGDEEPIEDADELGDENAHDDTDSQAKAIADEPEPTNPSQTQAPKVRQVRRTQASKASNASAPMPAGRRKVILFGSIGGAATIVLAIIAVVMLTTNPARLAIQTSPEGPFKVTVSKTAEGDGKTYDGAQAIELDPGDYYVDVVPASKLYQRKRLKVHLSGNQMLALPVVLTPTSPSGKPPEPGEPKPTDLKPADAKPTDLKPADAKPADAKPGEAKTFTATISSDEPGIEISVDGKKVGKTPRVKVENLALDKPHKVTGKKDGFMAYSSDLENVDRIPELDKYVEMVREVKDAKPEPKAEEKPKAEPKPKPEPVAKAEEKPKAEPKPKPEPKPEPVAKAEEKPKAEPKPKPEPVAKAEEKPKAEPKPKPEEAKPAPAAAKGKGRLACSSKPAGAEVWIDGKNTGKKTPVAISSAIELAAGKHKVIFKLNGKASAPQEITIEADQPIVLKGVEIPGA